MYINIFDPQTFSFTCTTVPSFVLLIFLPNFAIFIHFVEKLVHWDMLSSPLRKQLDKLNLFASLIICLL